MRALALAALVGVAPAVATLFVPRERSRVRRLDPAPVSAARAAPRPLGSMDLARSLDAVRVAGPIAIGGRPYGVGIAADRDFKYFFAVFSRDGVSRLEPISRPRDFYRGGAALPVHGQVFRFRLDLRLTDLVRGSELVIIPAEGSEAQASVWTTGEILDLLERKATRLAVDREEYYLAYLSDVDPERGQPTGTRSFLFFQSSRFRARAWTVAEEQIPEGSRRLIALGRRELMMERRGGRLLIYPRE